MIQAIENTVCATILYGWKVWATIIGLMVLSELGPILNFICKLLLGVQ